jgi:hypothetical protein
LLHSGDEQAILIQKEFKMYILKISYASIADEQASGEEPFLYRRSDFSKAFKHFASEALGF